MSKLFKFNQRAKKVGENEYDYSFGVIIKKINEKFSFDLVDNRGEPIEFININEWKIYSIWAEPYFERTKIYFKYSDPKGSQQILESGGRTLPDDNDRAIDFMALALLERLLSHFHRISCFENIKCVSKKEEKLKQEKRLDDSREYNHLYYSMV